MNYYNDNDPFVCKWLKELIKAGLIPDGHVDNRSITEIRPSDLDGFTQCHFFAGIGGWSLALRLAGWPDSKRVFTGSCPCQPFSAAGKGRGFEDDRHLWPAFRWLIAQCRPPIVFGEQVAPKLGRKWLDGVSSDLEIMGYEVGASDIPAAGVAAPHKRNRLFWVAISESSRLEGAKWAELQSIQGWECKPTARPTNRLADSEHDGRRSNQQRRQAKERASNFWSDSTAIPCADGKWRRVPCKLGNSGRMGLQGIDRGWSGQVAQDGRSDSENPQRLEIESALFPLADGFSNRLGALRGAGNAITPQVGAVFIQSAMEVLDGASI